MCFVASIVRNMHELGLLKRKRKIDDVYLTQRTRKGEKKTTPSFNDRRWANSGDLTDMEHLYAFRCPGCRNTYTKPGMRSGIRPTLIDSMLATNPMCAVPDASPVAGAREISTPAMGQMKGRTLKREGNDANVKIDLTNIIGTCPEWTVPNVSCVCLHWVARVVVAKTWVANGGISTSMCASIRCTRSKRTQFYSLFP
jgi:hypothetical protein